jgi:hypothetical protein
MVFALASGTALERRLDSECLASPVAPMASEKKLLFRGKAQVVRRPPKDGRPAQLVTCIALVAEQPDLHQAS